MSLSDHSAPGTAAAFSYQFERALHWLAKSPAGCIVGVETDDDVAVRGPDGSKVLEQDKHSTSDRAPFGDRSKDLWNTLGIWTDALSKEEVSAENTRFFMVTNRVLPEGIARQIGRASSQPEVAACIQSLETISKSPPPTLASLMTTVLSKQSRSSLETVILRCDVVDGADVAGEGQLRKTTAAHLQIPQWCSCHSDSILDELLGWLHATALSCWQQQRPAWIQRDHFVNQLHAIIEQRRRHIVRERAEHLIPVSNEGIGQQKGSAFVKQLHLITDDENAVDGAIREFIRCNIEKTRLSMEGNLTDDDWTSFETALLSRWEKIRARILRLRKSEPENDVGFAIFTDTTEDHREILAGNATEQVYLTSGTYHRLADMIRVGWHPRFIELMNEFMKIND